jgi:hypothetical protein
MAGQAVAVPTFKPLASGMCPAALLSDVTLHGAASASPPLWVETADGRRLRIVWPDGYSARFAPDAQLLDGAGRTVASEGDVLDLGGGEVDARYDWFACNVENRSRP